METIILHTIVLLEWHRRDWQRRSAIQATIDASLRACVCICASICIVNTGVAAGNTYIHIILKKKETVDRQKQHQQQEE